MGRDTKTFPICNPYHGEEGAKWTRFFKPDFISVDRERENTSWEHGSRNRI